MTRQVNVLHAFNKNSSVTMVFSQGKSFENKIIKLEIHGNGNFENGSFITWLQVIAVLFFSIVFLFSYLPLKTECHIIKSVPLVSAILTACWPVCS